MHPPQTPLDELKAHFSPGDAVRFAFRRRELSGVVSALGPKRAAVRVGDKLYRVPYSQLSGGGCDHSATEQAALVACRALLSQHNLRDWSAALDDASSRAAACDYRQRRVLLSRLFVRAADAEEVRDAILHEIAHALAGARHHHDVVWQKIARSIGCSAARCHDRTFAPPRWIARCANGCFAVTRHRRSRGRVCVQCKRAVEFLQWTADLEAELVAQK